MATTSDDVAIDPANRPASDATIDRADRARADVMISARQLTKSFEGEEVIHAMDLDIERGTIIGLIGPSGCGKTTTVRLLTGLLEPTSGTATIDGTPAAELSSAQRSRIGYLPQTPALFPDLSLTENLSFHASMYGLPLRRRRRIDELLEWVELSEHRKKRVADSSGGMQRRLALAAALVHDPDVVFLDEPTAGIDPILREKFWDEFRDIADGGTTMVVTTQYVGEAGRCDLVGLLSEGDLLLLDTPHNLRRAAFDGEVVDVRLARPVGDAQIEALRAYPFVVGAVERRGDDGLRIVVDDLATAMADLGNAFDEIGVETTEVREHVVDFDEAFVQVVKRHRESIDDRPGGDEADEAEARDHGSGRTDGEPADGELAEVSS